MPLDTYGFNSTMEYIIDYAVWVTTHAPCTGPFGGQLVGGSFSSQADLYTYTVRYAQNAPSSLML